MRSFCLCLFMALLLVCVSIVSMTLYQCLYLCMTFVYDVCVHSTGGRSEGQNLGSELSAPAEPTTPATPTSTGGARRSQLYRRDLPPHRTKRSVWLCVPLTRPDPDLTRPDLTRPRPRSPLVKPRRHSTARRGLPPHRISVPDRTLAGALFTAPAVGLTAAVSC